MVTTSQQERTSTLHSAASTAVDILHSMDLRSITAAQAEDLVHVLPAVQSAIDSTDSAVGGDTLVNPLRRDLFWLFFYVYHAIYHAIDWVDHARADYHARAYEYWGAIIHVLSKDDVDKYYTEQQLRIFSELLPPVPHVEENRVAAALPVLGAPIDFGNHLLLLDLLPETCRDGV